MALRLFPALLLLSTAAGQAAEPSRHEVVTALRKATEFFHGSVARHGGYVYLQSADLSLREAEGTTGESTVWVQPPGTPAVGEAFLDAYEATGETLHLDAAIVSPPGGEFPGCQESNRDAGRGLRQEVGDSREE